MSLQKDDVKWTIQKMCVDVDEYELIIEKKNRTGIANKK